MKGYLVHSTIRHDGTYYEKDDFIDESVLDEQSAKRLLFLNVISKAYKENEADIVPDQTKNQQEETVEETLDINFTLDELKEDAKELGLTFASNLGKAKLIKLIVENGHVDYFLDQLED